MKLLNTQHIGDVPSVVWSDQGDAWKETGLYLVLEHA